MYESRSCAFKGRVPGSATYFTSSVVVRGLLLKDSNQGQRRIFLKRTHHPAPALVEESPFVLVPGMETQCLCTTRIILHPLVSDLVGSWFREQGDRGPAASRKMNTAVWLVACDRSNVVRLPAFAVAPVLGSYSWSISSST